MKICPFVSHMLGDENSNTLMLNGISEKAMESEQTGSNDSSSETTVPSHLYCLRESCRFYKAKTDDCQFDLIFSMLDELESRKPNDNPLNISKDVDKIWKFQTKSVAELIKTFGDAEKKQIKSFETLKDELSSGIESIKDSGPAKSSKGMEKSIESLRKTMTKKGESLENLSTTMADLVVNFNESLTQLKEKSDSIHKRMEELETPDFSAQFGDLQRSIENATRTDDTSSALEEKLEEKLEEALTAQKEMRETLAGWQDRMFQKVEDMTSQQGEWEDRFKKLSDSQNELASYIAEGKKHMEKEQVRTGQKEARKLNNLGVTSFHNGAYEMARDQFLQAVKVEPEFAEAHNNLGLAYTELSDEDNATDAFSRAIEINPDLHAAYNNLGYVFFRQGNYDQAIEMYNEALGRSTDNSSAYTNLGNAYYKLDKMDKAHEAWTKALEIDPGNEKAKRNLHRVSVETK